MTNQRNASKRPATKTDEDSKPKVARQQKIPDWDYKSRFNVLNEKYKTLLEQCDKMKTKLVGEFKMRENYLYLIQDLSFNWIYFIKTFSFVAR